MRAIILAAGKGERLKGVIDCVPKPMVIINGMPILESNILLLKKYGITDMYINLHHFPEKIRNYFGNGIKFGVNINYSFEETLLGTAGAVKKIANEYWNVPERFILLYGDNLLEYDLGEIISFHEKKKGIATIALYKKDEVSQSGIVLLDNESKVLKFIEKPRPEQVVSNLVNTGIYVLEPEILSYIQPGKNIDFGKEVFPEMILNNERVFGIIVKGKLTAIDTPALYKQAVDGQKSEDI